MKKLIFIITLSSTNVFATGIPTVDVANIVQTTLSAWKNIEQVSQAYTQIENQLDQISELQDQFNNLNGDYFKRLLLNGSTYKKARRWVPTDYRDVLDMYRGLYPYQQFEEAAFSGWNARNDYFIYDIETYFDDPESVSAQRWEEHGNSSVASIGIAESSFNRTSDLIEETERLIDDMGSNKDAKASQDLNNRMNAQLQFLIAELIRVNSSQAASEARQKLYVQSLKGADKRMARNNHITSIEE